MSKLQREKDYWKKQWLGVLAGAALGLLAGALLPSLVAQFGWFYLVLWSAVAGGVLANLDAFIRAGAAVTRREGRWINLLVGLAIPALILAAIAILFSLFG